MALPIHAALTDPDEAGELDIEIRHTDSFLRVRNFVPDGPRVEDASSRPRERDDRQDDRPDRR